MMSEDLDLKEIERKAFRSTYQDGLWDIYLGLVIAAMGIFIYRPEGGYSPINILLMLALFSLAYALFWAGKRFITLPRMGQVRFGPIRKRRMTKLALVLGVVVVFQLGILSVSVLGWLNPQVAAKLNTFLKARDLMDLTVASIGSLIVGVSMILVAFFNDFPRGYYIAIMMSLAVFLMIWLNQPVYALIIGGLTMLPGLVLFVRFLRKYPLSHNEASYE
jgi:hypothetical protein